MACEDLRRYVGHADLANQSRLKADLANVHAPVENILLVGHFVLLHGEVVKQQILVPIYYRL